MSSPRKKYTLCVVPNKYSNDKFEYEAKFTDGNDNDHILVTSHRNLSQLGTCPGDFRRVILNHREMIFGDAWGKYNRAGKQMYTRACYIFGDIRVPIKLARFVRS